MFGLKRIGLAFALMTGFGIGGSAIAADFVGPGECKDCHEAEYSVWENTPHAKSYKDIHKRAKADAVTAALGERSMKRSAVCGQCHYTQAPKKPGGRVGNNFGPSCESCHGPGSQYIAIHNVYGPKGTKKEQESPAHKDQRFQQSASAGMRWPRWRRDIAAMPASQPYEVAQNCFNCHGMARDTLDGGTAGAMLDAGHPLNPDFELVAYSQGTIRHRFYDSQSSNPQMSPAELSRWFVTGQAASLVQAAKAMQKTGHPKYVAAQEARAAKARAALGALGLPEASALVSNPSDSAARALVAAIYSQDMDLSAQVGGMLPASYK